MIYICIHPYEISWYGNTLFLYTVFFNCLNKTSRMALRFTAHYCTPVFHKRCLDSTVFTWLGNVIQSVLWYWIQLHQAIQLKCYTKSFSIKWYLTVWYQIIVRPFCSRYVLILVVSKYQSILTIFFRYASLTLGPLFTKRTDIFPQNVMRSPSHEIHA